MASERMFAVTVGEDVRRRELTTGKEFTAYQLRVTTPFGETTVFRRYSEFLALHRTLKKRGLPAYPAALFPRKKLLGSLSDKTIAARRAKFGAWLEAVLNLPNVLFYIELRNFLNINMLARSDAAEAVLRAQRSAAAAPSTPPPSTPLPPSHPDRPRTGTLSIDELMTMFAFADDDFLAPPVHAADDADAAGAGAPDAPGASAASGATAAPPPVDDAELDETMRALVSAMGTEYGGDLFDPCAACLQPVADSFAVRVGRAAYHSEHLRCAECGSTHDATDGVDFYPLGAAACCAPCFFELHAPSCAACARPIVAALIASDILPSPAVFHPECYVCATPDCAAQLGPANEYVSPAPASDPPTPADFRCKLHFFTELDLICSVCALPMDTRVVRPSGLAPRHPACYTCTYCKAPIGAKFRLHDDAHYCVDCHTKLF